MKILKYIISKKYRSDLNKQLINNLDEVNGKIENIYYNIKSQYEISEERAA